MSTSSSSEFESPVPHAWRHWVHVLTLVALGLAAYSHSFRGEFVFDDFGNIVFNERIRDLKNYLGSLVGYRYDRGRFVTFLTFALNYRVGGLDPTGYHVVNLAIHLTNALLVYGLVHESFRTPRLRSSRLATQAPTVALIAAALFVSHPLQTQAVSYVVQRLASLATTFYLAAAFLYVRWRVAGRGPLGYVAALLAAVVSMKTKEIAFTVPLAIALYEALFFEGSVTRRVRLLLPILATLAIIPLTIINGAAPIGRILSDVMDVTRLQSTLPRFDYLTTECAVIATYLRLLILPSGQNVDHDYPLYHSLAAAPPLAGLLLILGLLATAVVLYRWSRPVREPEGATPAEWRGLDPAVLLISFGLGWFFLALSVESSVIPIADVMFEHRVYLPSVGFLIAAAVALALLTGHLGGPERGRRLALGVGLGASLVLVLATYQRNLVWSSEFALWSDSAEKSPGKARPHDSLGQALGKLHRFDEALPHLQKAVELAPGDANAVSNLGRVLFSLGRRQEAESNLKQAAALPGATPEVFFNLGRLYMTEPEQLELAESMFRRAIAMRPVYAEAYSNLAAVLNDRGCFGETIELLGRAADIVAGRPVAHYQLGLAHAALSHRALAEREVAYLQTRRPELAARLREDIAAFSALHR